MSLDVREHMELAATRIRIASLRVDLLLKANPYWQFQPRVPAGQPTGGRWTEMLSGAPVAAVLLALRFLKRLFPSRFDWLHGVGKEVAPNLRKVPRLWSEVVAEEDFDEETKRVAPPSKQRPEHRFRTDAESRDVLGRAGDDREYHHIVEQQLARDRFPPEMIFNTDNMINLHKDDHRAINREMSGIRKYSEGKVVREWMRNKTYKEHYDLGLELIEQFRKETDQ